jgi:hypothetical protein
MDWEDRFRDCHLQALTSDASDHCPILLSTNVSIHSKHRFHFELFWPRTAGLRLDALFRNLAHELQSWSAKQIGNVREQLLMARELIFKLDQASDRQPLSDVEAELRKDLKHKCLGLSSLERTIAR